MIDVYAIGRRSQGIHQALRRMASRNEIFYLHDTLPPPKQRFLIIEITGSFSLAFRSVAAISSSPPPK